MNVVDKLSKTSFFAHEQQTNCPDHLESGSHSSKQGDFHSLSYVISSSELEMPSRDPGPRSRGVVAALAQKPRYSALGIVEAQHMDNSKYRW